MRHCQRIQVTARTAPVDVIPPSQQAHSTTSSRQFERRVEPNKDICPKGSLNSQHNYQYQEEMRQSVIPHPILYSRKVSSATDEQYFERRGTNPSSTILYSRKASSATDAPWRRAGGEHSSSLVCYAQRGRRRLRPSWGDAKGRLRGVARQGIIRQLPTFRFLFHQRLHSSINKCGQLS